MARLYHVLSSIDGKDAKAAPILRALTRVTELRTSIAADRAKLAEDGELTAKGQRRQLTAKLKAAREELAALTAKVQEAVTSLATATAPGALPAGDAQLEAALLSRFAAMNRSARNEALADAVSGRDAELALALARANPRMSGIAPATHAILQGRLAAAPAATPNPAHGLLAELATQAITTLVTELTEESVEE
jgi:hypothetical protein